ncbi:MAG: hypothetical protein DRJ51_01710 [Thermoprotei archaeon]|nr:MAG: hypothetical protein DRJ51_01710 [Thermoprotei archaeon]RLF03270.1 MAG: hypothetical protein DRJ59_01065 [Thermoprotei archaeon]
MPPFFDLRINPPKIEENLLEDFLRTLSLLGFRGFSVYNLNNALKNALSELEKLSKDYGLDYVKRIDLRPKSKGDLNRLLRKNRHLFEIVVVIPTTREVARHAAIDRRTDVICFEEHERLFDYTQAHLMSSNEKVLEIPINPLLKNFSQPLLKQYYKLVSISQFFNLKIVATSGATHPLELRAPRDLCSILSLFEHEDPSYSCVRHTPFQIIKTNRMKLSDRFVLPGVIIESKED